MNPTPDIPISNLRANLNGSVIVPGDPGYDDARRVFFTGFDRRPAAVVRVADASDVSRTVNLARETGAELAVRGGGHSRAGFGTSEGGIVLDLSEMNAVEIDPGGRTAWAQAGITAGGYTRAAGEHGLATGLGDTASAGVGGSPSAAAPASWSASTGSRSTTSSAPKWSPPAASCSRRTRTPIPGSSGRFGAAAATSASRPGCGSGSTRPARPPAGCRCSRRAPR